VFCGQVSAFITMSPVRADEIDFEWLIGRMPTGVYTNW
jgi:hypothetical protein